MRSIDLKFLYFLLLIVFIPKDNLAQRIRVKHHAHDTTDLTFTGTKINPYDQQFDSTGHVQFGGYIDTYYSIYHDSSSSDGFSKFPTIAPRNQQFGLNIIQLSARYNSKTFRGTVTLFGGDCPKAAWSPYLNYVQEANLGFRLIKKLWLDAGFFRTHIGLESIQPRENIAMSLATTSYFEPYFLSGMKLTWQQSDKLAFQLNAFNSFNQYLETNKNKAVGFSLAYSIGEKGSITYSAMYCDESPDSASLDHYRFYNNLCFTYRTKHFVLGTDVNYGIQQNTGLTDPTKTASMFSELVALKYRITPKTAVYVRQEFFSDPNEILTGPIINSNHQLVGLDILGGTFGMEFKPIPNSYLRIESRYLQTPNSESIFYYRDTYMNYRLEFIAGLGLWF